jgi:hypothetical protein
MTVTTPPRAAAAAKPRRAPVPTFVPAAEAFRVLRAWRDWVARTGNGATGFALLNAGDRFGSERRMLVLTTDGLGAPAVIAALRALDDWAIEILLRTAQMVCRSLVVGVRHRGGQFELLAWAHAHGPAAPADVRVLLNAMTPWLGR